MLTAEDFDKEVQEKRLNLRYWREVIEDPSDFDAIEIHGVLDLGDGNCEVSDEEEDTPDFYSVYVHMKEGGIQCVGDHSHPADAKGYADRLARLFGWPITYSII